MIEFDDDMEAQTHTHDYTLTVKVYGAMHQLRAKCSCGNDLNQDQIENILNLQYIGVKEDGRN